MTPKGINFSFPVDAGEAPLLEQGSLCVLLERVGVLADFQLVYSQLAASCSAMAAAVAAFHCPDQVCDASHPHGVSEGQAKLCMLSLSSCAMHCRPSNVTFPPC